MHIRNLRTDEKLLICQNHSVLQQLHYMELYNNLRYSFETNYHNKYIHKYHDIDSAYILRNLPRCILHIDFSRQETKNGLIVN